MMFSTLIKNPLTTDNNHHLDKKKMRMFGSSLSIIIFSTWGVLFPWWWGAAYPLWPWVIAGLLLSISLINAFWIKPIYFIFIWVAHILGTINITILLSIVLYFFMLPVGIILKIIGRDPMSRKLESHTKSYRIIRNDFPKDRLERPF